MIDKEIVSNPAKFKGKLISVSVDGKEWRTMRLHCVDQRRGIRVWAKSCNRGALAAFKFAKCLAD